MSGFALIGRKLGHSFSPTIHTWLGAPSYILQELEPENLESFLQTTDLDGMNVTIPYKKAVLSFCSELSDTARIIGSVNTLVRRENGWYGDNTDAYGFTWLLNRRNIDVCGKHCVVFGTGGASVTVQKVLRDLGAGKISVLSRNGRNDYRFLSEYADASVLINTTPVGMYPLNGECLVSPEQFRHLEAAIDLIYNPLRTKFLMEAEANSTDNNTILCENGLPMLVAQAVRSAELFQKTDYPEKVAEEILARLSVASRNLVLIGMPGSGKSTIGKELAKRLNRPFLDSDEVIAANTGKTAAEWIQTDGEPTFRTVESGVLSEICSSTGAVIACGGGVVTRPENRNYLRQNGLIFWIQRDCSKLESIGRPLSQIEGTETLYRSRKSLYEAFSDLKIDNNGSVDAAVQKIMEAMKL